MSASGAVEVFKARLSTEAPSMLCTCLGLLEVDALLDLRDDGAARSDIIWRPDLLRPSLELRGVSYNRLPPPWVETPDPALMLLRERMGTFSVCLLYERAPVLKELLKAVSRFGDVTALDLYKDPAALEELAFWGAQRGKKSKGSGRGSWKSRGRGKKKTWADVARELEDER